MYESRMPIKYYCELCSFRTKRQSHLTKHRAIHQRKQLPIYHCKQCSFTTLRSSHLSRHQVSHCSNVLHCPHCPYSTDNPRLLKSHARRRHEGELLPDLPDTAVGEASADIEVQTCQLCGYQTNRSHAMRRHMKTHQEENGKLVGMFECSKCSYKTQKKMHFTRHMMIVHSEKRPFLCDTCGRGFKRSDALRQHRIVHMDRAKRFYPYHCASCSKGFRSPVIDFFNYMGFE